MPGRLIRRGFGETFSRLCPLELFMLPQGAADCSRFNAKSKSPDRGKVACKEKVSRKARMRTKTPADASMSTATTDSKGSESGGSVSAEERVIHVEHFESPYKGEHPTAG